MRLEHLFAGLLVFLVATAFVVSLSNQRRARFTDACLDAGGTPSIDRGEHLCIRDDRFITLGEVK